MLQHTATAIDRAHSNQGGRDETTPLHPWVIERLTSVPTLDRMLFSPATICERFTCSLRPAFTPLPLATISITRFCRVIAFHDFRPAFATQNARALTPLQLQTLMRLNAFATTQRYIYMAPQ